MGSANINPPRPAPAGGGEAPRKPSGPATRFGFLQRVAVVVALVLVIFGAVATWAGKSGPPIDPPLAAPSISRDQGPVEELKRPTMPGGWRDLKFGMSAADVKKIMHEHPHGTDIRWENSETTHLPTVRWDLRTIDDVAVDGKRYRHWTVRELDDGAENINAWHDRGMLIAIQLKGRAEPDAFLRKASEAYSAPPQRAQFKFFDDRTKMQQLRDVATWRGDDMTAFLWTSASSPMLLLWSNGAMAAREAEYQAALDAPATAARKAATAGEKGTRF